MKKYFCEIVFVFDESRLLSFIDDAVKVFGFEPKSMDIIIDEFTKPKYEVPYNVNELNKYLKKLPNSVTLQNEDYDSVNKDNFAFFRIKIANDTAFPIKTFSFEWSNNNLDFLLKSEEFGKFILAKGLIYCYCYDQNDVMEQSDNSRINPDFDTPIGENEGIREFTNNDVDVSQNWGRYLSIHGLEFMAAPLMWFGNEFYKIISKHKLLQLGKALPNETVNIKLFDLYSNPAEEKNRKAQKVFWENLNLEEVVSNYAKDNPLDMTGWLMSRIAKKKKHSK